MSAYYYLVSSLPMLEFGGKIPVPYGEFLNRCHGQLDATDMKIIERARIGAFEDISDKCRVLKEWKEFETDIRNEIVRYRAAKFSKDPARYIRGDGYPNPFVAGFAHWAVNQDSPLEAELYLDRVRWNRIEELEKGHYFYIESLIAYALKLQILERWQTINKEGGMQVLQELHSA